MSSTFLRVVAVTVALVSVARVSAQAQRPVLVGIGGGGTFPTGDFGADNKSGYNLGSFVQYRAPTSVVGLRGELQYHRNDMKDGPLQDICTPLGQTCTSGHWGVLYGGLGGLFEAMPRDANIGWFLIAAGGFYRITPSVNQDGIDVSQSENKAGFNAGGGLRFRLGAASLYMDARFHSVKLEGGSFTFLPVSFGIAF